MSAASSFSQDRERLGARCSTGALFCRWRRDRDVRAREALVREYLPLARKLASRWRNTPEPFEDLMQVATIGLLGAIDRFDPDRGVAFSSFAVPTILGELKRHFRDHCWKVHVTRSDQELALAVQDGRQQLTLELGRAPTVDQLAEYLDISVERALIGLDAASARHLSSLDAPVGDDTAESASLGETLGREDDQYALVDARLSLSSAVAQLSVPERELLELSFNRKLTQKQIGLRLGVSQMQVCRLLRRTLDKLGAAYHDLPAPTLDARSTASCAPTEIEHEPPAATADIAHRDLALPAAQHPSLACPAIASVARASSVRAPRPNLCRLRRFATERHIRGCCWTDRHGTRRRRPPQGRAPPPSGATVVRSISCARDA